MKQYTRLLAPNGRIGVGWGAKGKRYELLGAYRDGEAAKREDLDLLWMKVLKVGDWIVREHRTTGSRRSFTKWKPSSSQSPTPPEPEQSSRVKSMVPRHGNTETFTNTDDLLTHDGGI